MFLDSDDMVKEGSIKRFIEAISKYNLDFVEGNVEELYENQNIRSFNNFKMETTEILNGKEFFSLMIKNKNYIPVVWNKIYAKEFLIKNDLFFKERLISEDEDFTIRMLMSAKHVMHLSDDIYIYRVRDGSIMSMFNKNNDWISSYCYIINVIKNLIDKEHDVLIKRGLATRENQIVTSLIKNAVQCNLSTEEVDKIIEIIKLKKLYVIKPNPYGIVEQFQLKLIKYPKAFCQLYRFCLKMKEVLNL